MAGVVRGDSSHQRIMENSPKSLSHDMHDKNDQIGSSWYLSRKDIEENSPSRKDGIDLKKEAYLRKSYCTFLQDLGMRLKVPQVTIATAIVFCHRFFLRQSHLKNDRRTIATVCMFLAGKVEETPRPLKDVILVSYEIIHKKDPAAVQRIKQREVYEQQKELILLGERVVLATLGFDFNVNHPYKPLVEAIKKFKVAQNALAQVAWNFVNDGLRTSLGLQFKPHHIAAGAIFLAAKFLKVKLPSDGDKVWWQELEVTPRQLEEVSNQMLELYEQNRVASQSHGNEAEGSSAGVASHLRTTSKSSAAFEEPTPQNGPFQTSSSSRPVPDQAHTDRQKTSQRLVQRDHNGKEVSDWHHDPSKFGETLISKSAYRTEHPPLEEPRVSETNEINSITADAMSKIDKDRVKAAMEKRKRSRTEFAKKTDLMDEDDLIERELESGIELAAEDERSSQDRKQSWYRTENGIHRTYKEMQNAEGEVSLVDKDFHAPDPMNRKRKEGYELPHQHTVSSKHQDLNDSWVINQSEHGERDHKRAR